jgi:uncharacterized protein (TIGR03437 family)
VKYSVCTILIALAGLASAQTYTYSTFDPPGSTNTAVTGMNNAGQIVGSYTDAKGTHNFVRSADGSTYTTIDLTGATPGTTTIDAINNVGQITGTYSDASTGFTRCYIGSADGSTFTPFDLGDEFGPGGGPKGLNDNGDVAGALHEISADGSEGFLRTPDGTITPIDVPPGGTRVRGIDNNGDIVGWYIPGGSADPVFHGVLRNSAGVITTLDLPGTDGATQLAAINNHGQVTGSWNAPYGAFVSMADGSYTMLAFPGAPPFYPAAIDDNGRVAGYYSDVAGSHGFLAVPSAGSTQPIIRTSPPGVISASAFGGASTIAPGTWIEIYGDNLSTATRAWAASDFTGSTAPTSLSGVTVSIGGVPAFVSYISPGQVNALVPAGVAAGPAQVIVSSGSQSTAPFTVTVNTVQPSLLVLPLFSQNSRYLGAVLPDFETYLLPPWYPNVPTALAQPGDTIVLFGMGLGPVSPNVLIGQIASQVSQLVTPPTVFFNAFSTTTPATVTYAGLVAGTVGLYQINVVVPAIALPSPQTSDYYVNVFVNVNGVSLPSGSLPTFFMLPIQ